MICKLNNFLWIIFTILFIAGCASSEVSRNAATTANTAYQNSAINFQRTIDGNAATAIQNSSQITQGMLIGGATGAVAGGLSGVGVFTGAAGGAIFGGALGAYLQSKETITDQLTNRGAKIIILGDQILIMLPSRYVFDSMSATIDPYAYTTLQLVTELINGYPNMSVKVAAYTSAMGPERINLALSEEQAKAVMKFLGRNGVNTRLLYAEGYGGSRPVQLSSTWDDGENYRIEITLEKLPT